MDLEELAGQSVGPYRLEKHLGSGGFGAVYRAVALVRGETMGAPVAVKLIRADGQDAKRTLRELQNMMTLRHMHIVECLGHPGETTVTDAAGVSAPVFWFAMTLAEESLAKRIARQKLSEAEAVTLARQVGAALAWLHGLPEPRVHRDVKPDNILWVGGQWVLGDLGLTRTEVVGHENYEIRVTPGYEPPEAHDGDKPMRPWDVWAFGLTLIVAATGRHPNSGLAVREWTRRLISLEPLELPALPPAVDRAVRAALDKDPARRPAIHAVLAALDAGEPPPRRAEARARPPSLLVPELVRIPAGRFLMGTPEREAGRFADEGPQHWVTIVRAFEVGKYPVTFEEWDACVWDGGCGGYRPDDQGWGRGRRPVINVSWNDAQGYVTWLSGKTGQKWRLLTESEWEYAARGGTTTAYWWGDAIGRNNANGDASGSEWSGKRTSPVGSFAANPFGLHDMLGNVWEWVEDCWYGNYAGAPTDGSAWASGTNASRVVRGGSWNYFPRFLRSGNRVKGDTMNRVNGVGFRVARTLTS